MRATTGFVLGVALMFVLAAVQKQPLESRVKTLESRLLDLELEDIVRKSAVLDVADETYEVAQTKFGSFAFSLKDVEAFAGGTKLNLKILNLTSGFFIASSLEVIWSPKTGKSITTTHDILKTLTPGEWVANEIKNVSISPSRLQKIVVTITPNTLRASNN